MKYKTALAKINYFLTLAFYICEKYSKQHLFSVIFQFQIVFLLSYHISTTWIRIQFSNIEDKYLKFSHAVFHYLNSRIYSDNITARVDALAVEKI